MSRSLERQGATKKEVKSREKCCQMSIFICSFICDGEKHQEVYTETFALQRFGAFWIDYLYYVLPDDESQGSVHALIQSRFIPKHCCFWRNSSGGLHTESK